MHTLQILVQTKTFTFNYNPNRQVNNNITRKQLLPLQFHFHSFITSHQYASLSMVPITAILHCYEAHGFVNTRTILLTDSSFLRILSPV